MMTDAGVHEGRGLFGIDPDAERVTIFSEAHPC